MNLQRVHVDQLPTRSRQIPCEQVLFSADDEARPFVFYPANFWKHKNHVRLIDAMARVRASGHNVRLVCTGSRDAEDAKRRDQQ